MTRLAGLIYSDDPAFSTGLTTMLRSAVVQVTISDERAARSGAPADIVFVDGRGDVATANATAERLRAADSTVAIFFIASEPNPELIIRAMRAGANEFFAWPLARPALDEALTRTEARRAASPTTKAQAKTIVFFGAKGGAGTTTMAVNLAVGLARLSKGPTVIVDLKPGLGEVSLFLGIRSRYTLLDALDNLHRLDSEFLRELLVKHKSGLDILAGSDLFDRPGAGDTGALEEVFRLLGRQYEYIVIDAGSYMNPCSVAALYTADTVCLVANPDVPSIRNSQRLLDRLGQLGPCGDRVRVLLNRASEPYPIPPAQIQSALGHPVYHAFPSDYKTVSTALNSGVPLAFTNNTELASRFDSFARRIIDPTADPAPAAPKRAALGLERLASIW